MQRPVATALGETSEPPSTFRRKRGRPFGSTKRPKQPASSESSSDELSDTARCTRKTSSKQNQPETPDVAGNEGRAVRASTRHATQRTDDGENFDWDFFARASTPELRRKQPSKPRGRPPSKGAGKDTAASQDDDDVSGVADKKPDNGSDSESSASSAGAADTDQKPLEDNQDFCDACRKYGDLLCCDSCTRSYHLQCLDPPLDTPPEGEFHCPKCLFNNTCPVCAKLTFAVRNASRKLSH